MRHSSRVQILPVFSLYLWVIHSLDPVALYVCWYAIHTFECGCQKCGTSLKYLFTKYSAFVLYAEDLVQDSRCKCTYHPRSDTLASDCGFQLSPSWMVSLSWLTLLEARCHTVGPHVVWIWVQRTPTGIFRVCVLEQRIGPRNSDRNTVYKGVKGSPSKSDGLGNQTPWMQKGERRKPWVCKFWVNACCWWIGHVKDPCLRPMGNY